MVRHALLPVFCVTERYYCSDPTSKLECPPGKVRGHFVRLSACTCALARAQKRANASAASFWIHCEIADLPGRVRELRRVHWNWSTGERQSM